MTSLSLLAVSGSLRAASANTGLVRMAARLAPASLSVTVRDGIDRLPFYNADLDTPATLPDVCSAWRDDVEPPTRCSSPSPSTTGARAG